ncbi:MAG TPA: hypothetical protein VGH43_05685 [Jatrophihabitans sp.]|jgi:hypothetical protein
MHRRFTALVTVLGLFLAGLIVAAAPSSARVPRAPRAFSSTIEADTPYVPQDSCDSRPKHGTTMLGNLLTRTYKGTTWGSYRPCDGSVSEHHDGRAIDWMVSSRDARQHAMGHAFWVWLLAKDKYGNRFAMARRLGVMYIIFNSRMWGAWDGKWHEYDGCQTKLRARKYDNQCHRTHMHISLSWNGARGLTSFWTGNVYRTDYGPCVGKHRKYAPRWSHRNFAPCS